jgi:hypothetical protein
MHRGYFYFMFCYFYLIFYVVFFIYVKHLMVIVLDRTLYKFTPCGGFGKSGNLVLSSCKDNFLPWCIAITRPLKIYIIKVSMVTRFNNAAEINYFVKIERLCCKRILKQFNFQIYCNQ